MVEHPPDQVACYNSLPNDQNAGEASGPPVVGAELSSCGLAFIWS